MNELHMEQIFKHYIDDFEKLNNPEHMEYYKLAFASCWAGKK